MIWPRTQGSGWYWRSAVVGRGGGGGALCPPRLETPVWMNCPRMRRVGQMSQPGAIYLARPSWTYSGGRFIKQLNLYYFITCIFLTFINMFRLYRIYNKYSKRGICRLWQNYNEFYTIRNRKSMNILIARPTANDCHYPLYITSVEGWGPEGESTTVRVSLCLSCVVFELCGNGHALTAPSLPPPPLKGPKNVP